MTKVSMRVWTLVAIIIASLSPMAATAGPISDGGSQAGWWVYAWGFWFWCTRTACGLG